MYVLINELSFQAQGRDRNHAHQLMDELVSVIKSLKILQKEDPVCTSERLWEKKIASEYDVFQWLNKISKNQNQLRWFWTVIRKGPHIETLLDDYHECQFQDEDVSYSSLAGAFFFDGILTSLQNSDRYDSERICLRCQGEGEPEKSKIINVFNAEQAADVIEELTKGIYQDISSWNDLWTQKDVLFPELSFCECVQKQLDRLDLSPINVKIIQEHLSKMNEYSQKISDDEKILPDYQEMGLEAT